MEEKVDCITVSEKVAVQIMREEKVDDQSAHFALVLGYPLQLQSGAMMQKRPKFTKSIARMEGSWAIWGNEPDGSDIAVYRVMKEMAKMEAPKDFKVYSGEMVSKEMSWQHAVDRACRWGAHAVARIVSIDKGKVYLQVDHGQIESF